MTRESAYTVQVAVRLRRSYQSRCDRNLAPIVRAAVSLMSGALVRAPILAGRSGLVERAAQVGAEIRGGLNPGRQPDERGVDLERRPRDRQVGDDRRHLDKRFDPTE